MVKILISFFTLTDGLNIVSHKNMKTLTGNIFKIYSETKIRIINKYVYVKIIYIYYYIYVPK